MHKGSHIFTGYQSLKKSMNQCGQDIPHTNLIQNQNPLNDTQKNCPEQTSPQCRTIARHTNRVFKQLKGSKNRHNVKEVGTRLVLVDARTIEETESHSSIRFDTMLTLCTFCYLFVANMQKIIAPHWLFFDVFFKLVIAPYHFTGWIGNARQMVRHVVFQMRHDAFVLQ